MKITDVEALYLRLPEIQARTDSSQDALIVKASSLPNWFIMEYCVEPSEISRTLAKSPMPIEDGHADVPKDPGLGVEPTRRSSVSSALKPSGAPLKHRIQGARLPTLS
jgi:hypothetical protein